MIDLTKSKGGDMFAQTFVADPEHDHFIGPEVPLGEAWALTSLWMRAGKGGLGEAMLGLLDGEKFVALASRKSLLDGDSLSWSGDVLMVEGMAILYWTQGARQEEDIACSATWRALQVTPEPLAGAAGGGNGDGPEAASGKRKPKGKSRGEEKDEANTPSDTQPS